MDETTREVVELEIRELVRGTFLENAPIIPTSAHSGAGIAELKSAIAARCAGRSSNAAGQEWFRLAIDRSFIVQGHGTVVTGSVTSGSVRVGDEVEWQPRGETGAHAVACKITIKPVEEVHRGMRAAINLAGVHHEDVRPRPGTGHARLSGAVARALTVRLHCLGRRPTADQASRFRCDSTSARPRSWASVSLLDCDAIEPGGWGLAQLFLDEPATATWGQPFVVRGPSATQTLGGGQVLQPVARKIRRRHLEMLERVEKLWSGDRRSTALTVAWFGGFTASAPADLVRGADVGPDQATELIARLKTSGELVEVSSAVHAACCLHADMLKELDEPLLAALGRLHERVPADVLARSAEGAVAAGLRRRRRPGHAAVDRLINKKTWSATCAESRGRDFKPKLSDNQRKLKDKMVAGIGTPVSSRRNRPALRPQAGGNAATLHDLFEVCVAEGQLVPSPTTFICTPTRRRRCAGGSTESWRTGRGMTVAEIRDLLGTTRKYAVPLCEYLDASGVTRREGDLRKLTTESTENAEKTPR